MRKTYCQFSDHIKLCAGNCENCGHKDDYQPHNNEDYTPTGDTKISANPLEEK